jgi:hypothetical protein
MFSTWVSKSGLPTWRGTSSDEDIKLEFVGLRPGEKLFEELIGAREKVQPSSIQKVFEVVSEDKRPAGWFRGELRRLERFAKLGDTTEVMRTVRRIVPEFTGRPWDVATEATGKMRAGAAGVPLLAVQGGTAPAARKLVRQTGS